MDSGVRTICMGSGVLIFGGGRYSVGWNFHPSRIVRTIVLGVALSWCPDRFLVTLGPFTFLRLSGDPGETWDA